MVRSHPHHIAFGLLLACAGTLHAQNLLTNPSFENGLTGWTAVVPNVTAASYGAVDVPSNAVAGKIGGGTRLLHNTSGQAVVEQVVSLGSLAAAPHLFVGGHFGGVGDDDSLRLVIRFLDGSDDEIAFVPLPWVTPTTRNEEAVLLRREALLAIPAGSAKAVARIEFQDTSCCSGQASADLLFVEQVDDPLVPLPKPLGEELLVNPRFEMGWTSGSPLTLDGPEGWEGAGMDVVIVKPYSDADPFTPSSLVSCAIGGGFPSTSCAFGGAGNFLSHVGEARLRQVIDLRGNTADFAAEPTVLRVGGYLGGVTTSDDYAQIEVRLLDVNSSPVTPVGLVGPVTRLVRNSETVVVKRETSFLLSGATAFAEITVAFDELCCAGPFGSFGVADNISAVLLPWEPTEPVALNEDLATNGSFESGTLPGSPLELDNPDGWEGTFGGSLEVLSYGTSPNLPPTSFASGNGLGGLVLGHEADAALTRSFDVSGDTALIDAGRYRVYVSSWLGGSGTSLDTASVEIVFRNAFGGQVGGAGGFQQLGPVTAADRMNQTVLLQRDGDFAVPAGTATIDVTLRFDDAGGPFGSFALADRLEVVVYDTLLGGPSKFPGTGEDLRLFSGVNGPPTSGPGNDVESAVALDLLALRVESPNGTFDYAPLVLAANLFPTGSPPVTGIPGLALDPIQLVPILNGFGCAGFGCALVLPGGTGIDLLIPPTLGGHSVLIQAFALQGGLTPPANGVFAGSDAHEIVIQ